MFMYKFYRKYRRKYVNCHKTLTRLFLRNEMKILLVYNECILAEGAF